MVRRTSGLFAGLLVCVSLHFNKNKEFINWWPLAGAHPTPLPKKNLLERYL